MGIRASASSSFSISIWIAAGTAAAWARGGGAGSEPVAFLVLAASEVAGGADAGAIARAVSSWGCWGSTPMAFLAASSGIALAIDRWFLSISLLSARANID